MHLGTNFDRSVYIDTPLCVQVVVPKLGEETLVQAMSVIDDALKYNDRVSSKL
jgi:amidase